ncbi:MAG TPA: DUF3301 domain-containing protein [Rudaea sp.]
MIESLLPLLLVLAGFYVGQNALRARELARIFSRDLCSQTHVQLLDQTVALQRLKLVRVPARGLLLRRDYAFEFSIDGKDRHRGSLSILDGSLLVHNLAVPEVAFNATASNVVMLPLPPDATRH